MKRLITASTNADSFSDLLITRCIDRVQDELNIMKQDNKRVDGGHLEDLIIYGTQEAYRTLLDDIVKLCGQDSDITEIVFNGLNLYNTDIRKFIVPDYVEQVRKGLEL